MLKYEKSTLSKIIRIFIHSNSILFPRLKTYDIVCKYWILPKLAFLLKSLLPFLRKLILCAFISKFNDFFGKKSLDDVGFFTKSFFRNNRLSKLTQHITHIKIALKIRWKLCHYRRNCFPMFHKINWINNIEKTEKSLSQDLEWKEKRRHHIPKKFFFFM